MDAGLVEGWIPKENNVLIGKGKINWQSTVLTRVFAYIIVLSMLFSKNSRNFKYISSRVQPTKIVLLS